MKVLLISSHDELLSPVSKILELNEFQVESFGLNSLGQDREYSEDLAILIVKESGLKNVGETIQSLRNHFQKNTIWLCAPRFTGKELKALRECGANEFMAPAGWKPRQIAERILARLLLELPPGKWMFGSYRGGTSTMKRLYSLIEKVAPDREPVLILGERGTGKELCAKEIHRCSGRTGELFPINCAALNPELIESELFGHAKGAFSDAHANRKGLLVEAKNGTVFLDEIGELKPEAQSKLLRAIEENKVRPVGANHWAKVEARLILATNRDLEVECREGRFRADLYDRISTFELNLPPLRERKGDLSLLAFWFLERFNEDRKQNLSFPLEYHDSLFSSQWLGNVRELRKVIHRAAAFADEGDETLNLIELERHLERLASGEGFSGRKPHGDHWIPFDPDMDSWKDLEKRAFKKYARVLMDETNSNVDEAAKRAGMGRSTFYERLKR